MIITCEACGTSFKIKTSLIRETGSTVRCSKCRHLFIAYPPTIDAGKPGELLPDEKIESSIDVTFETDIDEEMVSKAFDEEIDMEEETSDDQLSHRDKEMKEEALGEKTTQGLFDETEALFEELERDTAEPEVIMSDLEIEDDGIIDLRSLVSGEETTEDLEFGDLEKKASDESELVSLDDLESEEDVISLEDLATEATEKETDGIGLEEVKKRVVDGEETVEIEDFDTEYSPEDETIILETPVVDEDEEILDMDDLTQAADDEAAIPLEEMIAEEEIEFESLEEEVQPEEIVEAAELEKIEFEPEGGVDTQLEDFEVEKEAEGEDPSKKAAKKAPKVEAEEEEFDFDFDSELEAEAPVKEAVEEEGLGLELDLADAIEDLEKKPSEAPAAKAETEEFELDFDLDEEAEPTAEAVSEKESELGLDLDLDEFDLDLEEEETAKAPKVKTEEFDLDFDMEAADIELETKEFDLGEEETAEAPKAKTEEFDLELDFEPEAKEKTVAAKATDEFDLDLDLDLLPEGEETEAATGEFDLNLDMDETIAGETEDLDIGLESGEGKAEEKVETEEFDLDEIEDFLDFGEETVEAKKAEPEAEPEKETLDMDLELDFETVTAPEEEPEAEEIDIDLETMLDEEAVPGVGKEKEVALETKDERQKRLTEEYRKTEPFEPAAPKPAPVEEYEAKEEVVAAAAPVWQPKKKRPNRILWIILAVVIALGLIYAGVKFFGAKEEKAPAPVSDVHGKLQIEMIANPNYTFVQNEKAGELLVVTGNVTNRYDHPRSNIEVKGNVYDKAGKVVVTSSAYCGNMFTDSDLAGLELETINKRLANRKGDNNANVGIKPGQAVPFTVVFGNLPVDVSEFEVEVTQSSK